MRRVKLKTLIIVAHPDVQDSNSQQFFKSAIPEDLDITYHYLNEAYPDYQIDVLKEQKLLRNHDRIIFQFPLYWYSSPAILKEWQDQVLLENFAYGVGEQALKNKELGLVLTIGLAEKDYQVGGSEGFSISELVKPFQALSKRVGMNFLKPLTVFQFAYKSESEQMRLLVEYLQYLTVKNFDSLEARENWFLSFLEKDRFETLDESAHFVLDQAIERIETNQMDRQELKMHLKNYEG